MSNNIDKRVVQMEFDNAEFERRIRITQKSIDGLKDNLEFEKNIRNLQRLDAAMKSFGSIANIDKQAEKLESLNKVLSTFGTDSNVEASATAITKISDAAAKVDVSPATSGIEEITTKLNALDAIRWTVFSNLAQSLIDFGKNIVNSSIGQILDGGLTRALNLENAQFTLEGLKVDWKEIYEDAETGMSLYQQIDKAVSGTAYGLDSAAKVASQLVASNIKAGSKAMQEALSGISGVAAMTNSTYDDIGSIFTTIAGNGKVMTEQIRQFSYRGLNMAATLGKYLTEVEGTLVTEADVYERLSDKDNPISAETFFKAAATYAEQATKANETYSGALSNVKSALSRLGEQIQTPKIQNMRKVFVGLIPVLNGVKTALMPIFELTKGGMEFLSSNAVSFLKTFAYWDSENKTILTGLNKLKDGVQLFSDKLRELDSDGESSALDHFKQTFFNIRDAIVVVSNTFKRFISIVFSGVKTGLFGNNNPFLHFAKMLSSISKIVHDYILGIQKDIYGAINKNDALKRITAGLTSLINMIMTIKGITIPIMAIVVKGAIKVAGVLMQILAPIADLFTYANRFFFVTSSFVSPLKNMVGALGNLKTTIVNIANAIKSNFLAVVSPIFPKTKKHVDGYTRFSEIVTAALQKVGDAAAFVFGHLNDFLKEHQEAIESIGTYVGKAVEFIVTNLKKLFNLIKNNKFLSTAGTKIKEWLGAFVEGLRSFKTHVQETISGMSSIKMEGLEQFGNKFKKSSGPIQAVGKLFSSIFNFLKSVVKAIGPLLSSAFTTISDGLSAILSVLANGLDGLKGNAPSSILAGGGIIGLLIVWAQKLGKWFNAGKVTQVLGGFKAIVNGILDYLNSIKKTYKPKIIESFANGILKLAFALLILSSIDPVALSGAVAALGVVAAQFGAIIETIMGIGGSTTTTIGKGGFKTSGKGAAAMYGVAAVITSMGTAVLMLAGAMKILSGMSPEQMVQGLASVMALLLTLTGIVKTLANNDKKMTKGVGTLIGMAIALRLLIKPIQILGTLPLKNLAAGIIAIVTLLGAMVGSLLLLSNFGGNSKGLIKAATAMLLVAAALHIIAKPIADLAALNPEGLTQGLLGIVAIITALTASMLLLSGSKGLIKAASSMVVMAIALRLVVEAITSISDLSWENLGKVAVALTGLIVIISVLSTKIVKPTRLNRVALSLSMLGGALALFIYDIKQFANINWETMAKAAASMGGLLTMFVVASHIIDAKAAGKLRYTFTLIAISTRVLASAMEAFNEVSWEGVARGLISFSGMALAMAILTKTVKPSKISSMASALTITAIALTIFGGALKIFDSISWVGIVKGTIAIAALLGVLKLAEKIRPTSLMTLIGAMVAMSAALVVMSVGLIAFTLVPIISIIKGLSAMAIAIVILSKASKTVDVKKMLAISGALALLGIGLFFFGEGLVLISAGLTAFVSAVVASIGIIIGGLIALVKGILEIIPWLIKLIASIIIAICEVIILAAPKIIEAWVVVLKTLLMAIPELVPAIGEAVKAILDTFLPILVEYTPKIVDALISILIGVINALAERIPELLFAVVNFFKKLIEAIVEIAGSEITPESMQSFLLGLTVFTLCLVAIAAAAYIAKKAIVGMVAIMAVIVLITAAFLLLSTIDADKTLAIGVGIAAALTAIAVCMAIVSMIPIAAAITGVAGLAIFVAGLTAVLVALGAIAQIPGVMWLIDEGTKVMVALGNAIGSFVGAIIGGLMTQISEALPGIADNLSEFMIRLTPFLVGAKLIDQAAVESVLALVGVIIALTAAEIIQGFANFLSGGIDFAYFGEQLAAFAPYIVTFANTMSGCDTNAILTAADAASALALFASNIPNQGGLLGKLLGENSLEVWGPQLAPFAENLVAFSNTIADNGGVDVDAIKNACEAGTAIAEMASNLPNQGGVVGWFTGENSMEVIAPQLAGFAQGLVDFSNKVSGENTIDLEKVKTACDAGKAIAEMASNLPNQGGVASWFAGENSMEVIAPQLSNFGKHLYRFATYASYITDVDKALKAVKLGTAIADMAANLPNQGGIASWFSGDNTLSDFGDEVAKFGEKIADFSGKVKDVNWYSTNSAITGLGKLVDMATVLDGFNKNNVKDFAESVGALGDADVAAFLSAWEDADTDCDDAAETFVTTFCTSISELNSSFTSSGKSAISSYTTGINQNRRYAITAFKTVLESVIDLGDNYNEDIFWIGANMVIGLANGIYMNEYQAINAAITVASNALKATKRTLEEKSPSKATHEFGKFYDLGFAGGIKDYGYVVNEASKKVSEDSLSYVASVRDAISSMDFNEDDPTIRPIVDLSNVRSGVSQIGRIMNDSQSYKITSAIARDRAEYSKRTNTIKVESTSKDVVEAVGKLEGRIDALGDRINGMGLYLDGKTVVGELTDPLDKSLGRKASKNNGGAVHGRVVQR